MSSNKIGFLSASALYVAIFLAIWQSDFKIRTIGESGESWFFSIRLENIESFSAGATQKKYHRHSERSAKARSEESKPRESNPKFSTDSNTDSRESVAKSITDSHESTTDLPTDSHESNAITQSALGENDPYFLTITRIINRFHAKAPVQNIRHTFEVGVAFSVNTMGEIEHLRIIKSSGNEKLDNIAIRTIRRASRTFPAPKKNYYIQTALVYKR